MNSGGEGRSYHKLVEAVISSISFLHQWGWFRVRRYLWTQEGFNVVGQDEGVGS